MVIADKLLTERKVAGKPIRVALVGAGVTGRMIALQLLTPVPGIELIAIANRTLEKARRAYSNAGMDEVKAVGNLATLEDRIAEREYSIVEDAMLVCQAANIDVIVDVTGTVEFGAKIALEAIRHGKHLVLINAELDATLGPILKFQADRAGTVITNTDGDEPGVAMTLLRYLRSLGLRPVAAGNLKGLIDPYRTPETQKSFAEKYEQDPVKVTSFADGTKLSMEATILANATGFGVGRRGMFGPKCAHVKEMAGLLPKELLLGGGLVDYALGAEPGTGAFVIVYEDHPKKQKELAYYKMGEGPFYTFYTPFHLPHLQIVSTIARAVLFRDATVAPLGGPVCEVLAVAKRDLKAGEKLDGVGGFTAYGVIENAPVFAEKRLLPMGIAEGCTLNKDVPRDTPITYYDVEVPAGRTVDELRREQAARFPLLS
jgi:predicted homoserine dehydrogenase-like protein